MKRLQTAAARTGPFESPSCMAEGCTQKALWELAPGFSNGRERLLCNRHLLRIRQESPIEADCYIVLSSASGAPLALAGASSRR